MSRPVQIGAMDRRITLQSPTVTRGVTGGQSIAWATQATPWASVEPVSEREFFDADQRKGEIVKDFHFRYGTNISGLSAQWRLLFDGDTYDIEPPEFFPAGRPRYVRVRGKIRNAEGVTA